MVAGSATSSRPTMAQVAELAGVSLKTVSRVINGEAYVSEAASTKVRDAIRRLRYYPDMHAGKLRTKTVREPTIGLIVGDVADPFAAAVHRAVEDVAFRHHAVVFATSSDDDPAREKAYIDMFFRQGVDGLILATIEGDHSHIDTAQTRGVKVVLVDREARSVDADSVSTDNAGGATLATQHLIEHGHRRIAYLGDRETIPTALVRRDAFLAEIDRSGIARSGITVNMGLRDEHLAYRQTRELLERRTAPPTALFAARNLVAFGVVRALHELGRQHDVALITFDDVPFAGILTPGITAIAQDAERIGAFAAERVLARIAGDASPAQRLVVPAVLVERGSGELPPPAV